MVWSTFKTCVCLCVCVELYNLLYQKKKMMMKKGLASQKSRPALLLPTRGPETLLVSMSKSVIP